MSLRTLYDEASLWMTPSGYEDGKLFSELPTDGSGDFTFSRGSNLAATRVGPTGLIEKGRENLYLHSNNFSDAEWDVKSGTFSQGVSDPNGGSNAWSWTSVNTAPYLYQRLTPYSGISCLSIWVKGVGSTIGANFQIRGGSGIPIKTITLTSDWQRVEHFGDYSANPFVGFEFGIPAVTGDVVHIYQAQYEQGLVATDYIESGATTGKAGLLENEPRLDYSGGATCPALLLEPQRSNLLLYSEYINNSVTSWSRFFDAIVTNNDATSPDGTKNATKIACPSSGSARIDALASSVAAGTYTYSCYAKGDVSNLYLNVYQDSSSTTLSSTQISTLINNSEWTRIDVTFTSTATSTMRFIYNTLPNGEHFHLWGAQLESGSYPTSYIPTYGGSSVTRSADDCYNATDDFAGVDQVTLFAELNNNDNDRSGSFFRFNLNENTSTNEWIFLGYETNKTVRFYVRSNSSTSVDRSAGNYGAGVLKMAAKIDSEGNYKVFANGVQIVYGSNGVFSSSLNRINIGQTNGLTNMEDRVKQLLVFPTALTDSECIALTTI